MTGYVFIFKAHLWRPWHSISLFPVVSGSSEPSVKLGQASKPISDLRVFVSACTARENLATRDTSNAVGGTKIEH